MPHVLLEHEPDYGNQQLNAAEYNQAVIAFIEAGMMSTTIYLSIVSGYLVVAYSVGRKLTTLQLWTISLLFV